MFNASVASHIKISDIVEKSVHFKLKVFKVTCENKGILCINIYLCNLYNYV